MWKMAAARGVPQETSAAGCVMAALVAAAEALQGARGAWDAMAWVFQKVHSKSPDPSVDMLGLVASCLGMALVMEMEHMRTPARARRVLPLAADLADLISRSLDQPQFFGGDWRKRRIKKGYKSITCLIPVSGVTVHKRGVEGMTTNKGKDMDFDFCLEHLFSLPAFYHLIALGTSRNMTSHAPFADWG